MKLASFFPIVAKAVNHILSDRAAPQKAARICKIKFTAYVKEIRGSAVLLEESKGKSFWAKLDTAVSRGEYLLLELKEVDREKLYYRILERSDKPLPPEEHTAMHQSLWIVSPFHEEPIPLSLRFFQESKPGNGTCKEMSHLHLVLETQNLGIIIVYIGYSENNGIVCRFTVQISSSKEALDRHIPELEEELAKLTDKINILPSQLLPEDISFLNVKA